MIKSIENGRKEDGNRFIADKIIKRLHDLEKRLKFALPLTSKLRKPESCPLAMQTNTMARVPVSQKCIFLFLNSQILLAAMTSKNMNYGNYFDNTRCCCLPTTTHPAHPSFIPTPTNKTIHLPPGHAVNSQINNWIFDGEYFDTNARACRK